MSIITVPEGKNSANVIEESVTRYNKEIPPSEGRTESAN